MKRVILSSVVMIGLALAPFALACAASSTVTVTSPTQTAIVTSTTTSTSIVTVTTTPPPTTVTVPVTVTATALTSPVTATTPTTTPTTSTTPTTKPTTPTTTTPTATQPPRIVIEGGVFTPSTLTVAKGTVVVFENLDHLDVTLISDYPFSATVGSELTFEFKFDTTGTFHYWDQSTPLYQGTVIVTG